MEVATTLVKANEEMRYTLGVLYPPNYVDLHGEWTSDEELHKAVIAYGLHPDKRLRLQHDEGREVGTVVELMRWPYPVEAQLQVSGVQKRVQLPAGTTFAGVIWDEDYWPMVKSGRITGYSMGGRAIRVREEGEPEVAKAHGHRSSLVELATRYGSVVAR